MYFMYIMYLADKKFNDCTLDTNIFNAHACMEANIFTYIKQ